uniref:Ig-like domain-containing protein n=1 Tax=Strongyloides stercoralis TaxID=6248 RepID=A0A0K0ENH6_STRER
MVRYSWEIFKIFFTIIILFLSLINGNDLLSNADGISFVVIGLAKPNGARIATKTTHKVADYKEFIENVKFHKTELFKMKKVQIKMDSFIDQQGVRVDFNEYNNMFLSIARKDDNGQYKIVSEKMVNLKIFCSVARCEPGVVLLSKKKLDKLEGVTKVDIEGAFYLEFYNTVPYIARIINTEKKRPYLYICPGTGWIHGSTDFNYEIHEDSDFWFDTSSEGTLKNDRYPSKNSWNGILKGHGSIYPVPIVEGIDKKKQMICGSIKRFSDNSVILQWAYEINYIPVSPSDLQVQAGHDKQNAIYKNKLFEDLYCSNDTTATTYIKIGYLPTSETKHSIGKFVNEPNKIIRYLFHNYHVLLYRTQFLQDKLKMQNEYTYTENSIQPSCVKKIVLNPNEISAKILVNPSPSSKEYRKHQINGNETSLFEIDNSSFDKTLSKIDIQCKVESVFNGTGLSKEQSIKFINYFSPYFDLGFKKTDDSKSNKNNAYKEFIKNGVLNFNKTDFDVYGMYQCDARNLKKGKEYLKESPETFLILPKNNMIFDVSVEVSENGTMNKECYFEIGTFANLVSITMEHGEVKKTALVSELDKNEYFEVKGTDKKYGQLKGELKKGDVLLCKYETLYNSTFYTKVSFSHEDDFKNSESAKTKVKKNTVIFVVVSIILFLLIIGGTVGAFVLLRKKRKRRRMKNGSSMGSLSKSATKKSKSNLSKSKSSTSKSKGFRSKSKASVTKSQHSNTNSKLSNLSTQKSYSKANSRK